MSGAPANLREVLKTYNRTEFHHLYPRGYLHGLNVPSREVNVLSNFAFVSVADNKVLGGVAPSQYRSRMSSDSLDAVLMGAAVPASLFADDYPVFIKERSELLARHARDLAQL